MKITETQLKKIINEETEPAVAHRIQHRIKEAEFYGETPEGQLTGTEASDLKFNLEVQVEKDVKSAIIAAVKSGLDVNSAVDAVLRTADGYQGY